MRRIDLGRLPAAAAGLLTMCCTLHLILLAAGVGALAAGTAGASLVALGIVGVGAGLWWTARRPPRRGDQAATAAAVAYRATAKPATDPPEVACDGG
jgi:hypothetical protein